IPPKQWQKKSSTNMFYLVSECHTGLRHCTKSEDEFRRVANIAAQQFYSEIRIVNVNMNIPVMNIPVMNIPATVRPPTNIPIKINDDENVRELLRDLFAE
ncbi:105_t:CDS:2, partial [Cetraspora pellucida]